MQNLNKQHLKDEQLANNWLKENGITNRLFMEVQVFQLQAYKTATNILKHNAELLKNNEYELSEIIDKSKDNIKVNKINIALIVITCIATEGP